MTKLRRSIAVLAGVLSAAAVLATGTTTAAETTTHVRGTLRLGPLTVVSHGLPFHTGPCAGSGIANRNAAAEPTITSDPGHPDRLLAAWFMAPNYDRLDHAGIVSLVARSDDGGRRWRLLSTPGLSPCAGGRAPLSADPAVAWGSDGWSYFVFDQGRIVRGAPVTQLGMYRFAPSGKVIGRAVRLPAAPTYNDRPTVTADPHDPARLYVAWVVHGPGRSSELAAHRDVVMLAVSTDHGQRWSRRAIYNTMESGLWGTQAFPVGRRGLVVTYRSIGSNGWQIDALHSGDLGRRWSAPQRIGKLTPGVIQASGVQTSAITSDLASPGPGDSVYTAWADNTSDGHGHVLLSRTLDGGRTWSGPAEVTDRACNTMLPAVAVNGNTVGVTYYAFRQCRPGTVPLVDVWFALSPDRGSHWSTTHLAGPFDFRDAVNLTYKPGVNGEQVGPFLGDYTGLTPTANGLGDIMILPRPYARYGQQDVFFRKVATQGGES